MSLVLYLLIAYLVGALPFSVIIGRLFYRTDVRRAGSSNAGATNTWRLLGWKAGLSSLILDVGKGAVAAGLVTRLPLGQVPVDNLTLGLLCGLTAVLGHVFPVYLGFRGGKGVATAAGMLVVVAPLPVACAVGVFVLAVTTSGYVSLGSILAAWAMPLSALLLAPGKEAPLPWPFIALTTSLALFITYTHRTNIRRLLSGREKAFPRLQVWRYLVRK